MCSTVCTNTTVCTSTWVLYSKCWYCRVVAGWECILKMSSVVCGMVLLLSCVVFLAGTTRSSQPVLAVNCDTPLNQVILSITDTLYIIYNVADNRGNISKALLSL